MPEPLFLILHVPLLLVLVVTVTCLTIEPALRRQIKSGEPVSFFDRVVAASLRVHGRHICQQTGKFATPQQISVAKYAIERTYLQIWLVGIITMAGSVCLAPGIMLKILGGLATLFMLTTYVGSAFRDPDTEVEPEFVWTNALRIIGGAIVVFACLVFWFNFGQLL